MQYGTFEVKLEGKSINTIIRHNCTPAEIEVLKAIHGPEAIEPLYITSEADTFTDEEMERLRTIYHTKIGIEAIVRLYPGSRPSLPVKFADIGYRDMPHQNDKIARKLAGDRPNGMSLAQARAIVDAAQQIDADNAKQAAAGKQAATNPNVVIKKKTVKKSKSGKTKFAQELIMKYPDDEPQGDQEKTA